MLNYEFMRMMRKKTKRIHNSRHSHNYSRFSHQSSGFSLVEAIIYAGLLSLILVSTVSMLLGMSRAYLYLNFSRHIQTSAITAVDRIVRDIRNAQTVNVAQSTLGTSPGVLTLDTTTATSSPQTIQFFVSNGVLRVKQDGGDLGPLTVSDVTVQNLVFRQMNTGISEAIKIELTLTAGTGPTARSVNFYATAILRDSY